jgi:hypothetical protein
MHKIIKAAAVTALVLSSASAFAWGNGPYDSFSNGFTDVANQFFGDGYGDGNADFNMNMNTSASGNGRGWGRGYDRFQGYNGYGYAPYYAYPYAPVAMGGAPQAPVSPVPFQGPVAR